MLLPLNSKACHRKGRKAFPSLKKPRSKLHVFRNQVLDISQETSHFGWRGMKIEENIKKFILYFYVRVEQKYVVYKVRRAEEYEFE